MGAVCVDKGLGLICSRALPRDGGETRKGREGWWEAVLATEGDWGRVTAWEGAGRAEGLRRGLQGRDSRWGRDVGSRVVVQEVGREAREGCCWEGIDGIEIGIEGLKVAMSEGGRGECSPPPKDSTSLKRNL